MKYYWFVIALIIIIMLLITWYGIKCSITIGGLSVEFEIYPMKRFFK